MDSPQSNIFISTGGIDTDIFWIDKPTIIDTRTINTVATYDKYECYLR